MTATVNISLLETLRLEMEPLEAAHAEELFPQLLDQNLHTFLEGSAPESVDWLRERYSRLSKRISGNGKQLWLNWVPRQKESRQCVGYFESSVEGEIAWLAYYVFVEFQGQGYAKEGMQEVITFLETTYGVRTFVIEMDTRNLPSERLAQALGFEWIKTTNRVASFKGFESHEFRFEYRVPSRGTCSGFIFCER
jgi:[ribosomal protein S5]-alanine N-acetyltransferase